MLALEIERVGGEVVGVQKVIRIAGEWSSEKLEKVKEELMMEDGGPDRILIGGPSKSTTRHGPQDQRGFCPERRMVYKEGGKGGAGIKKEYHLTEPVKISMLERGKLVRMVEEVVKFCEENFPTSTV